MGECPGSSETTVSGITVFGQNISYTLIIIGILFLILVVLAVKN